MLLLMRKRIGSVVVKAFAFLLILGFGAWGIQDMLGYQFGGGGAIAEVGEVRLEPNRFYREVVQKFLDRCRKDPEQLEEKRALRKAADAERVSKE